MGFKQGRIVFGPALLGPLCPAAHIERHPVPGDGEGAVVALGILRKHFLTGGEGVGFAPGQAHGARYAIYN